MVHRREAPKSPATPSSLFESLPLEVHFIILSNVSHTNGFYPGRVTKPSNHPLFCLSHVSRTLRASTLSYVSHQIQTLLSRFPADTIARNPLRSKNSNLTDLRRIISFLQRHCQFCGHATVLSAKLYPDITCCDKCDRQQWRKITYTDASKKYRLPKHVLKPGNVDYSPMSFTATTTILQGVKVRKVETRMNGYYGTLFLEKDIIEVAERYHGCTVEELSAQKRDKKAVMQMLQESRFEEKKSELQRWLNANFEPGDPELVPNDTDLKFLRSSTIPRTPLAIRSIVRVKLLSKKLRLAGKNELIPLLVVPTLGYEFGTQEECDEQMEFQSVGMFGSSSTASSSSSTPAPGSRPLTEFLARSFWEDFVVPLSQTSNKPTTEPPPSSPPSSSSSPLSSVSSLSSLSPSKSLPSLSSSSPLSSLSSSSSSSSSSTPNPTNTTNNTSENTNSHPPSPPAFPPSLLTLRSTPFARNTFWATLLRRAVASVPSAPNYWSESLDAYFFEEFKHPSSVPTRLLPWSRESYPLWIEPPKPEWEGVDETGLKVTERERRRRKRVLEARERKWRRWGKVKRVVGKALRRVVEMGEVDGRGGVERGGYGGGGGGYGGYSGYGGGYGYGAGAGSVWLDDEDDEDMDEEEGFVEEDDEDGYW
ncbi:hypothetical protein EX30DRAFT_363365 [Ascodesmis nigricans]|uniref:Uncharacterized protein n=1 Tax=Ascodesmis nigricans TaxID=341454 RepID=A0A4S2N052_9PEZI|nr:hypothetical protein EX30DRAFT_363365 [Ascodesmis nigricans]